MKEPIALDWKRKLGLAYEKKKKMNLHKKQREEEYRNLPLMVRPKELDGSCNSYPHEAPKLERIRKEERPPAPSLSFPLFALTHIHNYLP